MSHDLVQPHYIDTRDPGPQLSLNGAWNFGYADAPTEDPASLAYPYAAQIPDSLYWNLYEAGVLPHPYQGLNSKQYHWVDEKVWYFRRQFHVEEAARGQTAILCFDGLSYYSRVWLNGSLLGGHEGMFGGPCIDVSSLLLYGAANELTVEFKACNFGRKAAYDGRNVRGENREIVPWNIARDNHTSNGDWMVMGLWRGVRLMILSPVHLARPCLTTVSIEEGRALLRLAVEIAGPDSGNLNRFYGIREDDGGWEYTFAYQHGLTETYLQGDAVITLTLREKGTGKAAFEAEYPLSLLDYAKSILAQSYPESQFFERDLVLENPKLWWPHDMGDPFLYEVTLALKLEGRGADTLRFDFGVRTIRAERTPGPRARLRWDNYQLVINGRKVFLKGVNWMPQDALYREKEPEYRWSLDLVKNAGIHLVRIWSGGGTPESDAFYRLCDEKGLMVWQDHFIANTAHTEGWPQAVLEAQEAMNLLRIRNHPSLAIHCGGNEFNPYSEGNAAAMFVIDRTIRTLDPNRVFYYTTPDKGSAHIYRDMEPTWYRRLYKDLPFVGETGIHSFPSAKGLAACLSRDECTRPIPELTSPAFREQFPELLNHFVEYVPERVPRMLSRISQITDLSQITLPELAEASHIAAMEYYEILVQALRENYPVTAGVMPWVFRRTWTTAGIQLVDGFGQPNAAYYAVKSAYRNVEAHLALEHISFAPGETVCISVRIANEYGAPLDRLRVQAAAYSPALAPVWRKELPAAGADGQCFTLTIPQDWGDQFFFLTVSLYKDNALLARQAYWPKCLSLLENSAALALHRTKPMENFRLDSGPWLKPQVSSCAHTQLELSVRDMNSRGQRRQMSVSIKNIGHAPAFPVWLRSDDENLRDMAEDNYFWLDHGEARVLLIESDGPSGSIFKLYASAWNAPLVSAEQRDYI